jgi:hypothetical protein|tara:strand:- start:6449 stop:6937 length:489 start_codon:yes stop_codon:yes gene_type:complete
MSKKTPSQGLNYNFEIVFDKEKETTLQKIKRWISKQKPPLDTILKYLFSYVEKWYWDGKVLNTMAGVDLETKKLHELWEEDDRQITPHIVETGVFGDEGWSISISNPIVERGTTFTSPVVDASGNVRSVEDTKGDQGSRTTRLSEQSEGVGGVSKEIPDPWD